MLILVGLPQSPETGREGRTGPRHSPGALDGGHQRGLFAADKGAGAFFDLQVEAKAGVQDIVSEQTVLLHLLHSCGQSLDSQRVFGTDVDETLGGADGVGADEHTLEDGVRVTFEDGSVHESTGVTLVGVADDVLLSTGSVVAELPLQTGGETRRHRDRAVPTS